MLDLSKVTDLITGFFTQAPQASSEDTPQILDALQTAGFTGEALESIVPQPLLDVLQQQGIDVSQLDPQELVSLAQGFAADGGGVGDLPALLERLNRG